MIATFANPIPVKIEKTETDAFFDGGAAASGDGHVIAVSVEAGWFSSSQTSFLVVVEGGATGWVKLEYCKFPRLIK